MGTNLEWTGVGAYDGYNPAYVGAAASIGLEAFRREEYPRRYGVNEPGLRISKFAKERYNPVDTGRTLAVE